MQVEHDLHLVGPGKLPLAVYVIIVMNLDRAAVEALLQKGFVPTRTVVLAFGEHLSAITVAL